MGMLTGIYLLWGKKGENGMIIIGVIFICVLGLAVAVEMM